MGCGWGRQEHAERLVETEHRKAESLPGMGQGPAEFLAGWGRRLPGIGQGQAEGLAWMGGRGEGDICPSPVSCSDTSFITGRKEAISMVGWGEDGGCSCARVWPRLPPPPAACSGSQRVDRKSCWRGLLALQVKDIHRCGYAVHMCVHVYTYHIYLSQAHPWTPVHICEHPHQCSGTPLTYFHLHIPTRVCRRDPTTAATRTNGELIKGDSRGVVTQSIADTYGDLVLDGREQVHVSDVAAVLEGWVLLTDHNFGAVPGEG